MFPHHHLCEPRVDRYGIFWLYGGVVFIALSAEYFLFRWVRANKKS
jgi:hypothetical protein